MFSFTVKLDYNDHGYNNHGYNYHGYNDHGYNDHGYNNHGYNYHGYNKFTAIKKKIIDIYGFKWQLYCINQPSRL